MDEIKKKYQIVVSRYNEDISWLMLFKNITLIYNKGNNDILLSKFDTIQLPNIGRESHTYLYHIVQNYENLAEKTIFFQGKINDHKILDLEDYFKEELFIGKFNNYDINKLKTNINHIGKWKIEYMNGKMRKSNYIPYDWLYNQIGIEIDKDFTKIIWGANFSIHRDLILSKPKLFYQNILRYIDDHYNPEEGHFLERSWYMIFHNNFISKSKIGFIENFNFNNINNIVNIDDYEEVHIWIDYIPNKEYKDIVLNYVIHNKYINVFPKIENNIFNFLIKGNNDAHILIDFEETDFRYEFILGGWSNTRSVIRDYNNNTILNSFEKKTLNKYEFINFEFNIGNQIIIYRNKEEIFNFSNSYLNIKNIKIKSYFNSEIFWEYTSNNIINNKFKYYLKNDIYKNINNFYNNNYLDYYIEKIII